MGKLRLVPWSILSLACVAIACSGGGTGGPISDPDFDTESAGFGATASANDTGDPEGVDETGDGGPVAADHCLIDPVDDYYGYKYQCEGSVAVGVVIEGNFPGSPVTPPPLQLEFGQGIAGDGYDEPLVMACCPPYDASAPNCGQPHERACMIDLVEQGCKSIVTNLEDFAHDELGGLGNTSKRNAVLKIADYVRDHQAACVTAFRSETGIAGTLPSCDMDGNGAGFDSMLESGVWTFDPDGLVDNVEISIQAADWTAIHPLEGSPEICWSADENDGVLFLEIDPPPGSRILHLIAGGATVHGPSIEGVPVEGFGELSPGASQLAMHVDLTSGPPTLERFELHSASPAAVGTADASWTVESFHVRLWDRTVMQRAGEALMIPAGRARFAVSATAFGVSGAVTATNATPIVITNDGHEWSASAFTIDYRDVGEHADDADYWTLVVAPTQWHENL
jgi:hypothetical protein